MNASQILASTLLLALASAYAGERTDIDAVTSQTDQAPTSTEAWLELQRSGDAASPNAQPLSGEAMSRAHARYLKGFEHDIPMFFKHEQMRSE